MGGLRCGSFVFKRDFDQQSIDFEVPRGVKDRDIGGWGRGRILGYPDLVEIASILGMEADDGSDEVGVVFHGVSSSFFQQMRFD